MQTNRTYILMLVIALAAVVGWRGLNWLHNRPLTAKLNIKVAPADAVVTLNGKRTHNGIQRVRPDTYTVQATFSGFSSGQTKVTVGQGQTKSVGLALVPNSPQTSDWYNTHPEDQQLAQDISSQNFDNSQKAIGKSPLLDDLPYLGPGNEYRIDYGFPAGSNIPTITISTNSDQGKQDALAWIQSKGVPPGNLSIVYKSY